MDEEKKAELLQEIGERRGKVEEEFDRLFDNQDHPLWEGMAYYPLAGGKKVRPFLTMVATAAMGEEEEKALPFGVALELVHNFTLVHDDIMDDDKMRRGVETLHRKEDEAHAINAGDGLFALSFRTLAEADVEGEKVRQLLTELSNSVITVAEGQEEDINFEETFEIEEEEFIEMIEKKTGQLFKVAARGGAIISDASQEDVKNMGEYGRKMGIAFQLQDDYLDLVGKEEDIGKDVGSDIVAGKRTLIVIHALQHLSQAGQDRLISILESEDNTPEEVREALDLMKKAGSLSYCKEKAKGYGEEAKKHLDILPESGYKNLLSDLVDFMIHREK